MDFDPSALTAEERATRLVFAPGDDPAQHPPLFRGSVGEIADFAASLPRPPPVDPATGFPAGRYCNYSVVSHGYTDWAVPEDSEADDGLGAMMRMMSMQSVYNNWGGKGPVKPSLQLRTALAAPVQRELARWSDTSQFAALAKDALLVLRISLSAYNATGGNNKARVRAARLNDDPELGDARPTPRVWRLVSCFANTTLAAFHDRVLAPAMGWARHYHSYYYTVGANGAMFGPQRSGSIDAMHKMHHAELTLDDTQYRLAHLLRKEGDVLHYVYDLGDNWQHRIEVVQIARPGDKLAAAAALVADPSPLRGGFRPGQPCIVKGLVGAAQYNGLACMLELWNDDAGRWQAMLILEDSSFKTLNIKPDNLDLHERYAAAMQQQTHMGPPLDPATFVLEGTQLLAGEMACPPEDSNGCPGGMGAYGSLIALGLNKSSGIPAAMGSMNWVAHQVNNPWEFDLEAHRGRLQEALAGKKSAEGGQKTFSVPMTPGSRGQSLFQGMLGSLDGSTRHVETSIPSRGPSGDAQLRMTETMMARPDHHTEAVCAMCGSQPVSCNDGTKKQTLSKCAGCKSVFYCGAACQKKHWPTHKSSCNALRRERRQYKHQSRKKK